MKRLLLFMCISALVFSAVTFPSELVQAASDDECGIWLCLPAGFPGSACSGPYSAFKKRIKHFKPPLPGLAGCLKGDNSDTDDMSYIYKPAAYVPTGKVCVSGGPFGWCSRWKTVQAHHVPNVSCRRSMFGSESSPAGCTRTDHYIEIRQKNNTVGEPFYF